MKRWHIINLLIEKYGAKKYLEIGTRTGDTFDRIALADKHGVDPDPHAAGTHTMTSDEYFADDPMTPDLAFIDGLHTAEQVAKDWRNIRALNPRAVIVFHDCWPVSVNSVQEEKPDNGDPWNGTVWREWAEIAQNFPEAYCINSDNGCGVMVGEQRYKFGQNVRTERGPLTIEEYLSHPFLASLITRQAFMRRLMK
jgi:hypothetical protein